MNLTKVRAVSTVYTPMGRWILVLPMARDWAWSGSRWAMHRHGIGTEGVQISNWATETEALEFARENLLRKEGEK